MTKQYRSPVMASIHETAEGLHSIGLLTKQTMRKFDKACLTPLVGHKRKRPLPDA